jgi:hypothetical protein
MYIAGVELRGLVLDFYKRSRAVPRLDTTKVPHPDSQQ